MLSVVNATKLFLEESSISRFPPLAETARNVHFKSNKQFCSIVLHENVFTF